MHTTRNPFKRMMLAGVLAGLAVTGLAQAADAPDHARHDPARMEQRMAERQAALKAALKITPEQEAAWTAFTAGMQPSAHASLRPERGELRKLTTPERVERMRALRTQRDAAMAQREQATLQFYAALTPDQQKVFDDRTARLPGHGPHRMPQQRG